jgi:hypothetical protein
MSFANHYFELLIRVSEISFEGLHDITLCKWGFYLILNISMVTANLYCNSSPLREEHPAVPYDLNKRKFVVLSWIKALLFFFLMQV